MNALSSFRARQTTILRPHSDFLNVFQKREVSRIAEEVAFSRRRNDNLRSKIYLQKGREGDFFLPFLKREAEIETSTSEELMSERKKERKE